MRTRAQVEAHIRATPITGTPAARRAAFRTLAGPGPAGVALELGGVACTAFGDGPVALWLHGGGYMFGDSTSHANCAAFLAERADACIIVPDYRRAPEHAWPAPLYDAVAVLQDVGLTTPLIGDSAGGHLALVLATQTQAAPASLALISPNTDRTGRSTTRKANSARDLMNDDETDRDLAKAAFGDRAASDPHVSPLCGDLGRLPPTYLTASRAEVLAGDAQLLEDAARDQGADITAIWHDDLFHMWTLWPKALAPARQTLTDIAAHMKTHRPC
ncbi:alpha/beta hydrolase [uncultured Tateyamaria sp.]|uniref:alpha/beta hydrolase n=1 Tax=uncultured Tateyamaria sp. TaxID=455651 RepID=UPI00260D8F90|nr:alpha/beta hydrolase [uncultured Tateyamaria sp.]